MIRVRAWLRNRRNTYSHSFSTPLESKDKGLYYHAIIHYWWTVINEGTHPRPLAPDALVQHLLREEMMNIACRFRLLESKAAENAMNAALCQDVRDAEHRVRVEAHVRLQVAKSDKIVAIRRSDEETAIRTAYARETIELDLLLDRLSDPSLGPVWWISRYADLQFSAGDPEKKIKSILAAFSELRHTLRQAEIDKSEDIQLLVRRKIAEIFSVVQDERSLQFALEVMNRTLEYMGIGEDKDSSRRNGEQR